MRWLFAVLAGCGFHGPGELVPAGDGSIASTDAPADPDARVSDAGVGTPDVLAVPAPFALTGVHWLLPCSMDHDPNNTACHCGTMTTSAAVATGGGAHWHVAARVRGVMEHMAYTGGAMDGGWYKGGAPGNGGDNVYELTISAPAAHYYLNPGSGSQNHSWPYDYTVAFDIDAGATATFAATGQDGIQWMGVDASAQAIAIAGVTDPGQPYDGQWARLDVTAATSF